MGNDVVCCAVEESDVCGCSGMRGMREQWGVMQSLCEMEERCAGMIVMNSVGQPAPAFQFIIRNLWAPKSCVHHEFG